jgi:hypothetical protein
VRLDRRRLDPVVAERLVAAGERRQILDPSHLEPDEVDGVVSDPLRVGLREADRDLGCEAVALDRRTLWRSHPCRLARDDPPRLTTRFAGGQPYAGDWGALGTTPAQLATDPRAFRGYDRLGEEVGAT